MKMSEIPVILLLECIFNTDEFFSKNKHFYGLHRAMNILFQEFDGIDGISSICPQVVVCFVF